MHNKKLIALALMAVLVADIAKAEVTCTGRIDRIVTSATGRVSLIATEVFGDGNGRDICNLSTVSNGISISTCQGWLANVLSAKAASGTISIQYAAATTCTSVAAWDSAPAPWALFLN
jgi:hypothetical protein